VSRNANRAQLRAHRDREERELGEVAADRRDRSAANTPVETEDQRRVERDVDGVARERRAHRRLAIAFAVATLAERGVEEDGDRAERTDREVLRGERTRARRLGETREKRSGDLAGDERGNTEAECEQHGRPEQRWYAVRAVRPDRLGNERLGTTQEADAEADECEADHTGEPDAGKLVGPEMGDERGRGEGHRGKRDHRDRDGPREAEQRSARAFDPIQ